MKHVQALDKLLLASKQIMSADSYNELVKAQYSHLVSVLQHEQISLDDAPGLLNAVSSSTLLSHAQKEQLGGIVSTLLSVPLRIKKDNIEPYTKTPLQTHDYMHSYLTAENWAILTDASVSIQSKIELLVKACLNIGLKFPSENTTKSIIAILKAVSNKNMHPAECFDYLNIFKARLKTDRPYKSLTFECPVVYPSDVNAFMRITGFQSESPFAESKLAIDTIREMQRGIAARKSHGSVQTQKEHHKSTSSGQVQDMLQQLAVQMFSNQQHNSQIRLLSPVGNRLSRSSTSLSLPAGPLAIADTPEEAQSSNASAPVSTARETTPLAAKSLPEMIELMKTMAEGSKDQKKEAKKTKAEQKTKPSQHAKPKANPSAPKAKAKPKAKPSAPKAKAKAKQQPRDKTATADHNKRKMSVRDSKAAWAAGQVRLGDKWVQSRERKSLIARMPLRELNRRRMLK